MIESSWECEINGIQDLTLRQPPGTLRRGMWVSIYRPAPYDSIRALIRKIRELVEFALQSDEYETVFF